MMPGLHFMESSKQFMRTRALIAFISLSLLSGVVLGQSKTTEALNEKFDDAMTLYFYKNTLRMLNQSDDKDFDELIKDIEKLKFLLIDKGSDGFSKSDYIKLVADYKKESYEEMMTSRLEGRNFDVYLRESGGVTKGMVVLVNDSSSLYVLDLLGRVELSKVPQLFKTLDGSSDISKMIKSFSDKADRHKRGDEEDDDN
jgi:Domain of unknown function (DUF4252)